MKPRSAYCTRIGQSERHALLRLALLDEPELFCIGNDQIHMLVESEQLPDKLPCIIQGDSEPVVDEAHHLAALLHGCLPSPQHT